MIVMLPLFVAVLVRPDHEASRSEPRAPLHALDWSGVARCESGGNWHDTAGMFDGGLQFLPSTWVSEGGTEFAATADLATEAQQIEVAERLLRDAGVGAWPRCGRWLRDAA